MKRVTIKEIAERLCLSRNTVSKALTGSSEVADDTKLLVIKTANEMGYPPYKISRLVDESSLSSPDLENKSVLVLSNRETSGFWNRIILGVSDVLNSHHVSIRLHVISRDEEARLVMPFNDPDGILGIIAISVFDIAYIKMLMKKGLPVVFLDAPVHFNEYLEYGDIVMTEGVMAMRQITQHLIDQGMTRFCFIADCAYCRSMTDRLEGFLCALRENHIDTKEQRIFSASMPHHFYDYDEVSSAIDSLKCMPEAFICGNDDIARDVYKKISSLGLSVPKDTAVTGFDCSDTAGILHPALTTAQVHNHSIGKRLAKQLLLRAGGCNDPNELIYIASNVKVMESSRKK